MRAAAALVVALAACGRIGFDGTPVDDAGLVDAAPVLDGPLGDPSLALYMDFEGTDSFLSTNEYPTVCSGPCPTPAAGRVGQQAAAFGFGGCVTIGASALRPDVFTFAAWVRTSAPKTMTAFTRPFEGQSAATNTFEIYVDSGTSWRVIVNSLQVGASATLDEWHHIAGTYDGATLTMYLDGVAASNRTVGPVEYTTDDLLLGCDIDTGVQVDHFDGVIDDVRVYTRELSGPEVAALAI